jgi:hypothetical protein
MRRSLWIILAVLFVTCGAKVALADTETTYTYTGNDFTSFIGGTLCPPQCNISGSITFSQALSPNLSNVNFAFAPTLISYDFADGLYTIDPGISPAEVSLYLSTDASGNISKWSIDFGTLFPNNYRVDLVTVNTVGEVQDETTSQPTFPGGTLSIGSSPSNSEAQQSVIA